MSDVLSVEQACDLLKVAKVTLYGYCRTGQVPCFKLGRSWKFHRESLDRWLQEQVQSETAARKQKKNPRRKK